MALTSVTALDVVGKTASLTYNNPGAVDLISFANNQITFGSISQYSLAKSDALLYFQFMNTFNNLLLINFPTLSQFIGQIFPLCQIDLSITNVGIKKIIYTQTSAGTNVLVSTYLPIAGSASISARGSPVTISMEEWFYTIVCMAQFTQQINLN